MKLVKTYDLFHKISKIIAAVSCIALAIVMLFTVLSIIIREVFRLPIVGANEIVEVCLAVLVFTCICYSQTSKAHINLFVILLALPKKLSMIVYSLDLLVGAVVSGFCAYALFLQGSYAAEKALVSALRLIPYAPFYYIAAFCMSLFTIILLLDTLIAILGIFNHDYTEHVRKDWA